MGRPRGREDPLRCRGAAPSETGEKGRTIFGPNWERTEEERKVCLVLEEVAKEVGVESITSGALAPHNA
jgi:hypothetical protein